MPKDTFMKLSQEKKEKIVQAAKKEFARVPFEETSIKNIVEDAGIARGSFYQYFESKEELLQYIMHEQMEQMEKCIKQSLKSSKGDVFQAFIDVYDYVVNHLFATQDFCLHKRIFENMKTGEDTLFKMHSIKELERPFPKGTFYSFIDTTKLKIEKEEDISIIIKMLYVITRKALVSNFKDESEQARKEFVQQIQYLKFGAYQEREGEDHVKTI